MRSRCGVSTWRRFGRASESSRDAKHGPHANASFHGIKKPGSDGSQGGKGLLSLPGAIGSI
jgi:hypothetical protein